MPEPLEELAGEVTAPAREFRVDWHPLGREHGWLLTGPDGEIWARGEGATRERMAMLVAIAAGQVISGGAAAAWISELVGGAQP